MTTEPSQLDKADLRWALGRFVTGVTVVTAMDRTGPVGVTANSFTSVSLEPPLVLFCVHRCAKVRGSFSSCGHFAVNILGEEQESVSRQFARPVSDRFDDMPLRVGRTGAPLLTDALAYLECVVENQFDAGDHVIVLGGVREFGVRDAERRPLTFFRGRYHRIAPATP